MSTNGNRQAGVIAVLAMVASIWQSLQGLTGLPLLVLGLISSVVVLKLTWGLRTDTNYWLKNLSPVGSVVSAVFALLFVLATVLYYSPTPPTHGWRIPSENITSPPGPLSVTLKPLGVTPIPLTVPIPASPTAEVLEVRFSVESNEGDRIRHIIPIPTLARTRQSNVSFSLNDKTRAEYLSTTKTAVLYLESPNLLESLSVNLNVDSLFCGPTPAKVRISYEFWKHDWVWRSLKWFYIYVPLKDARSS
jgi:hypothetical protein